MQCGRDAAMLERRNDLAHVVAVDLGHFPAESFELRTQRREIVRVGQGCALLEAVVIDDQRKIVELELGGRHDRFPVGAFLHLAVTGDDVGMVVAPDSLAAFAMPTATGRP